MHGSGTARRSSLAPSSAGKRFLFDLAETDPASRQTIEAWQESRRQLARLLRAPSNPDRLKQLQELTREKERLERQLAEALPEFARQQKLDQSPHSRLLEALPDRTVVLDLAQFTRLEQDPQVKGKKGERRTPSYVGFLLSRGRPVHRRRPGPGAAIDEAVAQWREAIVARQPSAAAETSPSGLGAAGGRIPPRPPRSSSPPTDADGHPLGGIAR